MSSQCLLSAGIRQSVLKFNFYSVLNLGKFDVLSEKCFPNVQNRAPVHGVIAACQLHNFKASRAHQTLPYKSEGLASLIRNSTSECLRDRRRSFLKKGQFSASQLSNSLTDSLKLGTGSGTLLHLRKFHVSRTVLTASVNEPAPQFTGQSALQSCPQEISLKQFQNKFVVLLFYDISPRSLLAGELMEWNTKLSRFTQLNCEVLCCSTNPEFGYHENIGKQRLCPRTEGEDIKLQLISDPAERVKAAYEVDRLEHSGAFRALFIVDEHQILRHKIIDETTNRSVDKVLRLVWEFQKWDKEMGGIPSTNESLQSAFNGNGCGERQDKEP